MDDDGKREIGERGHDKEKRDYNKKSLFNLKQFQKPITDTNPVINPAVNSSVN